MNTLVEALKPFAKRADGFESVDGQHDFPDDFIVLGGFGSALPELTVGHFRRAREALSTHDAAKDGERQSAWLIECPKYHPGEYFVLTNVRLPGTHGGTLPNGRRALRHTWTRDVHAATRFPTKEAAEAEIAGEPNLVAVEHLFGLTLSTPTAPVATAEVEGLSVRPHKLTMPNGEVLECECPTSSEWAKSWRIRYPDTGQIGTTGEEDWELVERYGLTAILNAALSPAPQPAEDVDAKALLAIEYREFGLPDLAEQLEDGGSYGREEEAALRALEKLLARLSPTSDQIKQAKAEAFGEAAGIALRTTSYDDNLQKSAGCATTGQRIAERIRALASAQAAPSQGGE